MRFAIVESGGKQYRAVEGRTIEVDRLPIDAGKKFDFERILLIRETQRTRACARPSMQVNARREKTEIYADAESCVVTVQVADARHCSELACDGAE